MLGQLREARKTDDARAAAEAAHAAIFAEAQRRRHATRGVTTDTDDIAYRLGRQRVNVRRLRGPTGGPALV